MPRSTLSHAGQVHELELAYLHLVTVLQLGLLHPLAVEVGAVERSHVSHHVGPALAHELRMPSGHGDVVQENVAVGVTSHPGQGAVEQEPASSVRAPLDHQDAHALGSSGMVTVTSSSP